MSALITREASNEEHIVRSAAPRKRQPKSKRSSTMGRLWGESWPTLTMVMLIIGGVWVLSLFFPSYIMPNPIGIAAGVWEVFQTDWQTYLITLQRFLLALASAIIAGWLVGLLMGAFRNVFGVIMQPFIKVIQAIPSLSWILLVILWFNNVELRIWFVTFILAFPFFVIAVYEGIRDIDKDMMEAVEQFRPNKLQIITKLFIPQSFVNLITVMKSIAAMTLKIMIFAEMIGANDGVGQSMSLAQSNFRIDIVLAWTVFLVVTNFIIQRLVTFAETKLLAWRAEAVVR